MGIRQELVTYRVAFTRRYPISDELKRKMINAVESVLDDPKSTKRELMSAAKVLIAAEQQCQTDETQATQNDRILQLAERIGVRGDVERIASESTGIDIGIDAETV